MADYSNEQLKALPLADSPSTPLNIVSAARNGVCSVYRSAPGLLTQPDGSFVEPFDTISDTYRQFLDNLCDEQPLPPLGPSFAGGKCAIPYVVSYQTVIPVSPSGTETNPGTVVLMGPLQPIRLREAPGAPSQMEFVIPSQGGQASFIVLSYSKQAPRAGENTATITNIVAQNPALDICGGFSPRFPERVTGPNDYNPPVQYRDRGVSITTNVNIPPIIIPPGAIQISPKLEVKIGPNRVTFDLSGGTLKVGIDPTINIGIGGGKGTSNPNPPVTIKPDLDGELVADRFDRIEDLLEELKDCACDDEDLKTLIATPGNNSNAQCVAVPVARNRYVALAMTQKPANPKSQFGNSAPDVYYAGWAWFKSGDYLSERQPIDAEGKLFKNPGGFEAFCYTMQQGYLGTPVILDLPNSDE